MAGNAGRVPRRTCAQCGGMWGTRLDAQVSPDANLEGAVLEVSPGQEGWRWPGKRAAIALRSGRIAPLINSHRAQSSPISHIYYPPVDTKGRTLYRRHPEKIEPSPAFKFREVSFSLFK